MPLQKAEALFDFKPTAPVELELKKGDVVMVRRTSVGEGWWEGELNGKRGLFPCSFVKMLPASAGGSPVRERVQKAPLTPSSSKKVFMDTLLTPSTNIQDQIYDKDKASDLFVRGHSDISITAGPRWDCFPPTLTIAIKDLHTTTRFSGVKHFTVFDVETKQLGTQVTRRYKNFLWLYDKMAELFPCISLPPLPIKQFSGLEEHGIEARRRGLENFLNRVANHPVLGSTKLLHDFLTAKDDKDWKIGRQLSNIKLPKSAKRLFTAPVYSTVKYPPFNVPINQLPSIEKFSGFSRLMELQIQALQNSCRQLCHSNEEMISKVNTLGRDIQKMARGSQPSMLVVRRKMTPTHSSNLAVPNGQAGLTTSRLPSDVEEEESDGELDENCEWNWRDDSKFNCMMRELYDVASGMRKLANLQNNQQESIERNVLDALSDYVGIIHTLPTLVKLHEEAMEVYNHSKEKDTKKEAEEVRQHCETLSNIVLAEFDYFSTSMVDDFENIILSLLKEQATFHRQVAKSWDSLYDGYINRRASTQPQGTERVTSSGKTFSFDKSGSYRGSFSSSHASTGSYERSARNSEEDFTLMNSPPPEEPSHASNLIPTYINVQRMDPAKLNEDSWEKVNDDEASGEKSDAEDRSLYESVMVHQLEGEEEEEGSTANPQDDVHSYANIQLKDMADRVAPKAKSAPNSPKKPKKPMPIRRKQGSGDGESQGVSSLSSSLELTHSGEANVSPILKPKTSLKPLPPAKPQRPIDGDTSSGPEEKPLSVNTPKLNQLLKKPLPMTPDKPKPLESKSSDTEPHYNGRARSKTTNEGSFEKKLPLLPPLKPLKEPKTADTMPIPPAKPPREVKTTDDLPSPKPYREANNLPSVKKTDPPAKAVTSTVVANHPPLKAQLSEPARSKRAPQINPAEPPSQNAREELMRKLSQRRQRIEQQLGAHKVTTHKPNIGNIVETPSERNSTISSSSSEVVVSYSTRPEESLPPNGAPKSGGDAGITLRTKGENESLVKYGIIEDSEGGSYII